jgi:hypothetical protein
VATRRIVALLLAAVVVVGTGSLFLATAHHPSSAPATRVTAPTTPLPAEVSIVHGARTIHIPGSFLGLSTEYWAIPVWDQQSSVLSRVLSLLRVPGDGPLVLRIGGDSADEALWESAVGELPAWVVELTPAWLSQTSALVRHSGVRLILDLNLVTASPAISAQWADAAEDTLPRGGIAGFEIGNEPDLYNRSYWMRVVFATIAAGQLLPRSLSASDYAADFNAYARAVAAVGPGEPLLGPAVAYPSRDIKWISTLLARPHPGLRAVSAHWYPYSACARPGSPGYPTIARLLSEAATAGAASRLAPAVRLAHSAGLPFRLTELNSVTCRGRPGVSDTFTTALWAPDALFELLRTGVDAVNVHVRPGTSNAAFSLTRNGLSTSPLLYGLILFSRTLGPGAQLVPVHTYSSPSLRLKVWAVRLRSGALHVLLINKGDRPAAVALRLPGARPATVERLLAPSASARSGVTLGGRHLSAAGAWVGSPRTEWIVPYASGYRITVPRFSAALVDVPAQP